MLAFGKANSPSVTSRPGCWCLAYGTVTRDLTEARLADQRLRLLASIVETSDDAIVGKNLDGVITSWNRGAENIFGYSAEEAIGRPITIVIPGDRHGEERDILTRIRRGERIELRNGSATQGRQADCRFINRFARQKCRRQDCWSIKDRAGYYRAEAKSGANRHLGSGSGAPKQELACDRASNGHAFSVRHTRRSKTGN
jgi:PAS domain S-box-containing protein